MSTGHGFRTLRAACLDSLADSLAEAGDLTEALDHAERALPLWEELAAETNRPSTDLAWSMWQRARWRAALDDADPAVLSLSQRAVDIYEQTSETRAVDREFLAAALVNHARHLARAGRCAEAVDHSARALALREALAADKPLMHRPALAECLRWHADHLERLGEHRAALDHAWRAMELAEEAAERTPLRYRPDLAAICGATALLLKDSDPGQARELAARSAVLYERLAADEPGLFEPRLLGARATVRDVGGSVAVVVNRFRSCTAG